MEGHMGDGNIGIIVGFVILIIVLFVLYQGIKFIKNLFRKRSVSDQEALQSYVNVEAGKMPDGPGAGLKNKSGCAWLFWLVIAIVLCYLLISGGVIDKILGNF